MRIVRLAHKIVPLSKIVGRLVAALAVLSSAQFANAQTTLPSDANPTCTVSAVEFASWFTSGTVTANGAVDPADSITFPDIPNCDFYKWSMQMFLWLTSPAPSKYGPSTHVFNSSIFYDVSPADPNAPPGQSRTFIANTSGLLANVPGGLKNLRSAISQVGPQKKPVVFDAQGKMFTVVRPESGPRGKMLIRDKLGQPVEIERTEIARGKLRFLDNTGKLIDPQLTQRGNPILKDTSGRTIELRAATVRIGGMHFILDAAGNLVESEQGQSDGSVLMAQNGSLVYFLLQTNDVYAYLRTGTVNGGIAPTPNHFPTAPADLNKIKAFGLAHSKTFPDANALAIEVKSAWIETTGLDASKYVTITATIPTYDTSNPTHWVATGVRQARLAMVGMHVVGSTAGHPEMIWATFEHINNTPNAQYTYRSGATTKTVPQSTAGTWLFSATGATGPFNDRRMSVNGADIDAESGKTIGPSDILRINPWGTAGTSVAFTNNNTDIIAINNSVLGMLAANDVRRNYIKIGSTWTAFGQPPSANNQVGTNKLASSVIETFFQQSNCFSCHGTNQFPVSHIFGDLKPLFP